ncbi:hypothetical protein ACP4OV_025179 [Aristida adscensionis]
MIKLKDLFENLGVKLIRPVGVKTNYIAGNGSTTSIVLARGLIAGGMKILLVDKKITDASEIIRILDNAVKENYPLLIVTEDVEEKAMADLIKNTIKVAAVKAFYFGEQKTFFYSFREQKTQCLDVFAVLTGGTVVRNDIRYTLEKVGKVVLDSASK